MSEEEFDEQSLGYEMTYGDIEKTSFIKIRPGKIKTIEDEFWFTLYQQCKNELKDRSLQSFFPTVFVSYAISLLIADPKLQKKANPALLVFGIEYNRLVKSGEKSLSRYLELFNRASKCKIHFFDVIRYNRLISQIEGGDNIVQIPSIQYKVTEVNDTLNVERSYKKDCPEFQFSLPSAEENVEGNMKIMIEYLPMVKKVMVRPVASFDTLESVVNDICVNVLKVPISFVQYKIEYHTNILLNKNIKEFNVRKDNIEKNVVIEFEEENIKGLSDIQNKLNESVLYIRPITYITENEDLSTEETIKEIKEFILHTNDAMDREEILEITNAECYGYFVCFGLLSSLELYDKTKYDNEYIWNAFIRQNSDPWFSIPAEGRYLRLNEIIREKVRLSQELTVQNLAIIRKLSEEERIIREKLLTKTLFNSIRDQISSEFKNNELSISRHNTSVGHMNYLLSLKENFSRTNLKDTEYTLEGTFSMEGYDTYELFNQLQVSYDIPFCSAGKFHKVLNGVVLPKNWVSDNDKENIIFYMRMERTNDMLFSVMSSSEIKSELYTRVFINAIDNYKTIIKKDGKDSDAYVTKFKVVIDASYSVNEDELLKKFLSSFQIPPMDLKIKKLFGKGEYVIAGISFSENVFHDYAFNDPLVREFITINERSRIYKQREGYKFFMGDELKCSIKSKIIEKSSDPEIKMFPLGRVTTGDTVYHVKIKRVKDISIKDVLEKKRYLDSCIQYILNTYTSRFLAWYCPHVSNIGDYTYSKYVLPKKTVKSMELTHSINPRLFVSGYSRKCNMPIPISEEESIRIKNKMLFPKTEDVTDERPQFWYKCPGEIHKYPSLTLNNIILKNKKETEAYHQLYPFIPCCLEQSKDIPGTLYYSYLHDPMNTLDTPIFVGEKAISRSKTILDKKTAVRAAQLAHLPRSIRDILTISNEDALLGNKEFVRFGVPSSKNGRSFITACCMGIYFEEIIKSNDILKKIEQKELELVEKLIKVSPTNINSQSCMTIEEGIDILRTNQFINPRDWIDIMEYVIEANIVVFYYDKEDNKEIGKLIPQSYERFILRSRNTLKPYKRTLLLYNSPDNLSYLSRHTELIILRTLNKKITQTLFNRDDASCIDIYNNIINILPSEYLIPNAVKQEADAYGKIRSIYFKVFSHKNDVRKLKLMHYNNTETYSYAYLRCTPIAPLSLKEVEYPTKQQVINNKENILSVMNSLGAKIYRLIHDNKIIGLIGIVVPENRSLDIEWYGELDEPLEETELNMYPVYDISCNGYPIPIKNNKDDETFFKLYSSYTRQSNCLLSYMYYLFSTLYYSNHDMNLIIDDFIRDYILIDKNHEYMTNDRLLNIENNNFIKDSKLIVTNELIKDRLIYNLKLQIEYNDSFVREYRLRKYIPNFYNNSKDFTSNEHFTIYYTALEYMKSREKEKTKYKIYDDIPYDIYSFYIQNEQIFDNDLTVATLMSSYEDTVLYIGLNHPFVLYNKIEGQGFVMIHQSYFKIDNSNHPIMMTSDIDIKEIHIGVLMVVSSSGENKYYVIKKEKFFDMCYIDK
jgi:hypothetical protein